MRDNELHGSRWLLGANPAGFCAALGIAVTLAFVALITF